MRPFLSGRTLCEGLEELPLLFVVSSHKLFMELLKEEERKILVEQMRKRSATINLSAKPLPSFYDIPGTTLRFSHTYYSVTSNLSVCKLLVKAPSSICSVVCFSLLRLVISCILGHPSAASASVNIGQLEQQLILSLEPRRIRQILIELHGMAERPFWRVNSKVRGRLTDTGADVKDIKDL